MKKTMVLVVVLLIGVVLSTLVYILKTVRSNESKVQIAATQTEPPAITTSTEPSITPTNTPTPKKERSASSIIPKGYTPVPESEVVVIDGTTKVYNFNHGQADRDEFGALYRNSFSIRFPVGWDLYLNTKSDENSDEFGTNLLITRGLAAITIDQQFYETGSCYFSQADAPATFTQAMFCTFVQNIEIGNRAFTIFKNDYYGLDQLGREHFSTCISEESDKICGIITPYGRISADIDPTDKAAYADFISILESIKIL